MANYLSGTVSVINCATNSLVENVTVGRDTHVPSASTQTLTTNKVYVANFAKRNVSVIDGVTNSVERNRPGGQFSLCHRRQPHHGQGLCGKLR